jgi:hypothetical protein
MKFLYHGTRYLRSILLDQRMLCPADGEQTISFTARKHVARYFAELWRDDVYDYGSV